MFKKIWSRIADEFRQEKTEARAAREESDLRQVHINVRTRCGYAGKTFFSMLRRVTFTGRLRFFSEYDQFQFPPSGLPDAHGDQWDCLAEYWLTILAELDYSKIIVYPNPATIKTQLLGCAEDSSHWRDFQETHPDESERDKIYGFLAERSVLASVCTASVQVCEEIIEALDHPKTANVTSASAWQPPEGYIGSKEAVNKYDIPRSTLQQWETSDRKKGILKDQEVIQDPSTQEKFFPLEWLEDRKKRHKSRPK